MEENLLLYTLKMEVFLHYIPDRFIGAKSIGDMKIPMRNYAFHVSLCIEKIDTVFIGIF